MEVRELEARARGFLSDNGILPREGGLEFDMRVSCPCEDGHDRTAGRYILHTDFPPTLWLCNHYRHDEAGISLPLLHAGEVDGMSDVERNRIRQEIDENKAKREQARAERQNKAAEEVRYNLGRMKPASDENGYLKRKGVHAVAGLFEDARGNLVVPAYDYSGKIVTCQTIPAEAGAVKLFYEGGKASDVYFPVNRRKDGPIAICEGIATALSVHEATGWAVLSVFSAGNLEGIAKMVRARYPRREIIICGDNDTTSTDKEGVLHRRSPECNTGRVKAHKAAEAVVAKLVICPEVDEHSTDFNDLHKARGLDAVRKALDAGTEPEPWGVPVEFTGVQPPKIDPNILPPVLRDYCKGLAEEKQVPLELAVAMALAALATAVQLSFVVEIRPGYREGLNIYVLCPLDPSNRKSAIVADVLVPIMEWEREQAAKLGPEIRKAESLRKTMEEAIREKRSKAAKAKTAEDIERLQTGIDCMEERLPVVPRIPRLTADNTTPEALAVVMFENRQCVSILTAEGGLFDILAGMYSKGVPNLDLFLKGFSGDSVRIDRKNTLPIIMDNPRITMGISPQPVILSNRSASEAFRGRGLDGRFLYFMTDSLVGYRDVEPPQMSEQVKAAFHDAILRLLPADFTKEAPEPTALQLSSEAYREWLEFSKAVEQKLRPGGTFDGMRDWGGKLCGQVARIAGLFHLLEVDSPEIERISGATMRAAIVLGATLAEHARAAYALMGTDDRTERGKAILEWIRRKAVTEFSERDCFYDVRNQSLFPHVEQAREGLAELEDRGFIRSLPEPVKHGPGRRPSTRYMVNPAALKR